ncbi:alkaline phosphatase PhoX [Haloplanus halobius]|uniref:alkaline phosphatase PhoX n=1 Tax=Haloplanus halobius TaxID=2934938 RepID=UPI00200FCED7|nr:alkaline phosphatase PhoX [Haloplanus sp. XH21]
MAQLNRRNLMRTSVAAAVGASVMGVASAEDTDTDGAPWVDGDLKRFATTAFGAEVTGPFVLDSGTLIFSLQHPTDPAEVSGTPSVTNAEEFQDGGVGYVSGFQFDGDGSNDEFDELSTPQTADEQGRVRTAGGEYELLAREKDPIDGGDARLGVPNTPDGTPIDSFSGSKYSAFGNDPDMNQFVATPAGEYDGYLFTNFEQTPGTLSRMPLTIEGGSLTPALDQTVNLADTEAFRSLGGTKINCYGDLSPWGTPLSAEEEYAHTRVSLTATVGEMVEDGGVGRRGGAAFWNRPNPTRISGLVGEYYDTSWYPQGTFALAGTELLAYYLGADPIDQDGDTNTTTPIAESYPNRYDYGYIVDFRNPEAADAADIDPVKYYVMGRGAWEAPDIQHDRKTAYLTSDGSNKGIYKFVADRPIPSYSDPMDIAGTLYAPLVTNTEAAQNNPPADIDLELEWLELGHATNGEVAAWIAAYDDVSQVDYLETHADTDWETDLETALEEADRDVIENGNQNYITDQEIVDWAEQYEANGPDGVDEDLRRVPFLETRAAAKEIGATIEFRKAEGIDSVENATPGDYVYIGLSEVNDGFVDDEGKIQTQRVDGGMVYRAELEPDYNISTLEPVIVGPDATDRAEVADDALLNIDNVWVMDDGRVLCCEDADQFSRSYPNDCMYVFDPAEDASRGRSSEAPGQSGDAPGQGGGNPGRGRNGGD